MIAVQAYIKAIKNYKNIGGSIDDAIVIAETILLTGEKIELQNAYNKGYQDGLEASLSTKSIEE